MYIWEYESPLGRILIAEKQGFLTGAWFENQKYFPESLSGYCRELTPVLEQTCQWLDGYFSGSQPPIDALPLAPEGSAFRQQVWQILCRIPYGEVTTYAAIARKIAHLRGLERMSSQAVGGAVAHNPISVIIPCHRVVGTDGSLTGYAGGLERKRQLLTHEGIPVRDF